MISPHSADFALIGQDTGGALDAISEMIELASVAIEVLAVAIIIIFTIGATFDYVRRQSSREDRVSAYDQFRIRLARGLLLGLEILVAADIIYTVALDLSLDNVVILGILVLIRTFLSWSLVVEIEHRWPWQRQRTAPPEPASADTHQALGGGHA